MNMVNNCIGTLPLQDRVVRSFPFQASLSPSEVPARPGKKAWTQYHHRKWCIACIIASASIKHAPVTYFNFVASSSWKPCISKLGI